ncbi:hypothetical protein Tco_0781749 [Tanacetum coccineum]
MQRNKIDAINDDSGNTYEGVEVADQFVKHFQKFLGESVRVDQIRNMERLIKCKLNAEEASYMVRDVSDKEIKNAMFQIDDNKAPGPDGYTSLFFKRTWSIIVKDVYLAVKEFFETGKILKEINSTLIALVPKIQTPLKIVSKNQCAYIPERRIQENMMLVQELLKGYDRKIGPKRVALKRRLKKCKSDKSGLEKRQINKDSLVVRDRKVNKVNKDDFRQKVNEKGAQSDGMISLCNKYDEFGNKINVGKILTDVMLEDEGVDEVLKKYVASKKTSVEKMVSLKFMFDDENEDDKMPEKLENEMGSLMK